MGNGSAIRHEPTVRHIGLTELTPENFAPFGQLIMPTDDGVAFGPDDAQLVLDRGIPRYYMMRLPRRGLSFRQITRHRQVTQCLATIGGRTWYMGLAPPGDVADDNAEPDPDDIHVFAIPGDVAIKLHLGTWHAGPLFDGEAISFLNLELADTNTVDHHSCDLDRRYGIRFVIDV